MGAASRTGSIRDGANGDRPNHGRRARTASLSTAIPPPDPGFEPVDSTRNPDSDRRLADDAGPKSAGNHPSLDDRPNPGAVDHVAGGARLAVDADARAGDACRAVWPGPETARARGRSRTAQRTRVEREALT